MAQPPTSQEGSSHNHADVDVKAESEGVPFNQVTAVPVTKNPQSKRCLIPLLAPQ